MSSFDNDLRELTAQWLEKGSDIQSLIEALRAEIESLLDLEK